MKIVVYYTAMFNKCYFYPTHARPTTIFAHEMSMFPHILWNECVLSPKNGFFNDFFYSGSFSGGRGRFCVTHLYINVLIHCF